VDTCAAIALSPASECGLYTRYLAGHELSSIAGAIPQALPAPLLQPHPPDRADLFLAGFSRPPHFLRALSHNLDHYA